LVCPRPLEALVAAGLSGSPGPADERRPRESAIADRARKAVTSRIRETIARIGKEHGALGLHLDNAIRTGVFCSYRPDRSPEWHL